MKINFLEGDWILHISTPQLFVSGLVGMLVFRLFFEYLVFRPFARRHVAGELVVKLATEMFRVLYFFLSSIWGLWVVFHQEEPWWWNVDLAFKGCPHVMTPDIRLFYTIQLSFYFVLLFFHLFVEVHGKRNYWDLLIHHLATIGLISYSWYQGFSRIGVLILPLHDVADVFCYLAKCSNFLNLFVPAAVSLGIAMVIWIFTRLSYFPYIVIYHGTWKSAHYHAITIGKRPLHDWWPFQVMLITLVILHYYWFYCFLNIIYETLKKGSVVDKYLSETLVVKDGKALSELEAERLQAKEPVQVKPKTS